MLRTLHVPGEQSLENAHGVAPPGTWFDDRSCRARCSGRYLAAGDGRIATADCYSAAVKAWRRVHPDQSDAYARKQAVAVILAAKAKFLLRVE